MILFIVALILHHHHYHGLLNQKKIISQKKRYETDLVCRLRDAAQTTIKHLKKKTIYLAI